MFRRKNDNLDVGIVKVIIMQYFKADFLKSLLKKWPAFYRLLQELYYGMRRIAECHFVGSRIHEWNWSSKGDESAGDYWDSVNHPHRKFLLEKIAAHYPFDSILEIGCNSGPNLALIARTFPTVTRICGVDINSSAIEKGRAMASSSGLWNVEFIKMKADCLSSIPDYSYDIVFSDATLIYIGPDKIEKVLFDMMRISAKAIVLNEWDLMNDRSLCEKNSFYWWGHWVHNYRSILSRHIPLDKIKSTKITRDVWNDDGWSKFGAVLEIPKCVRSS